MSLEIIGIMAVDPNGVIGKDNALPWNYPDETKHFLNTTQGHVLIMGRRTFESMSPKSLKDRTLIVFSHHPLKLFSNHEIECTVVSSLEDFLSRKSQWKNRKLFMIGGAEIAHLFLENGLISEFILTKIHQAFEGNTYLNLKLLKDWPQTILFQTPNYTVYHMKNPQLAQF